MFADIGFPNPEREQLMAHLILQICRIINSRRCEIAMNSGIFLSAQLQGDLWSSVWRGGFMRNAGLPITLIVVGSAWLLWYFRLFPDIDWIIAVGLVLGGSAVLYLDGMTKNSIVAGPILIASGIAWALHDRWRVTWFVLMPMLLVLLGVLMLIARRPNIPERRARQT